MRARRFLHPCLQCGACCAQYRVSMHWMETSVDATGNVPVELTESFGLHQRAMRGTSSSTPRCIALLGEVGAATFCSIHPQRPQACRDVPASWEFGAASPQCDRARAAHGLPLLQPADWDVAVAT